jgi:hypothetical protein
LGPAISTEIASADPLASLHRYLSSDAPWFRVFPPAARLERLGGKLTEWDPMAARFRRNAAQLREGLGLASVTFPQGWDPCLLALPIRTRERDALVLRVWERQQVWTENIYTPPLSDYLPPGAFDDLRRHPERDRIWSEELMPIPVARSNLYQQALGPTTGAAGDGRPRGGRSVADLTASCSADARVPSAGGGR